MALRLPYTHPTTGAHFPEAVARLEQVFLNLADSWLVLRVAIYPDAATATQGREPLAWRTHVVPAPVFDATMRPQAKGLGYSYLASPPRVRERSNCVAQAFLTRMDNTPVELPVDVVQALVEIAARTPRGGALLSGIRVGLAASGRLPREVKCKIEVAPAFLVPAAE